MVHQSLADCSPPSVGNGSIIAPVLKYKHLGTHVVGLLCCTLLKFRTLHQQPLRTLAVTALYIPLQCVTHSFFLREQDKGCSKIRAFFGGPLLQGKSSGIFWSLTSSHHHTYTYKVCRGFLFRLPPTARQALFETFLFSNSTIIVLLSFKEKTMVFICVVFV